MESNIILYSNQTGTVSIKVTYRDENFWLSQKAIAALFGVEVPACTWPIFTKQVNYNSYQLFPFWKQFSKKVQEM
jgi:hypothetical protein